MKLGNINERTRIIIILVIVALVLLCITFNCMSLKQNRKSLKIVKEQYTQLLNIHNFENVFEIDNEIVVFDNLQYKKILNYEKVLDENFTENGKNILNENLKKYILKIADTYYLKLDELNFETEYKKHKYTKVNASDDKIEYEIKSKILFIDQKGILTNKITLVKNGDNWLIDDYKIEKYIYKYDN